MSNLEDRDPAFLDTIEDQVRSRVRQLSTPLADRASSRGIRVERRGGRPQLFGQTFGGDRTVPGDISPDVLKIEERLERPGYLRHDLGSGVSSGVPQVRSHLATSS